MREITLKNNHFIWRTLLDVLEIYDYDEQDKIESIQLVILDPEGGAREVVLKNNNQIWNDICREILEVYDYNEVAEMDSMELTVLECDSKAIKEKE